MHSESRHGRGQRDRAWAIFFARMVLGLIFFMGGVWKVFDLGPVGHGRRFFIDPYADSFLPTWSLWAAGTVVPVLELGAGGLLLMGFRVREALLTLGGILVLVTFGHLVAEPLYQFPTHVIPRLALLLFLLWAPSSDDRPSPDGWLARRAAGASRGSG